jgi:autotransporter passenger strand-loop-strand repeat protein
LGEVFSGFVPGAGVVVEVASGGTAVNTILMSGATLEVLSGGLADPTIVSSGTTTVSAGGTDNGAQISGGTQLVYGVANAAIVFAGAEIVESGGLASGTTVSSGGTLDVLGGGTAIAPHPNSGATSCSSPGSHGHRSRIRRARRLWLRQGATR